MKDSNKKGIFESMFTLLKPLEQSFEGPQSRDLPDPFQLTLKQAELPFHPSLTHASTKRRTQRITSCSHTNRKHYAKGMCSNCYHRIGRQKLAWNCVHTDKVHYAKGMCQFCYLQNYHQSKLSGDGN